MFFTTSTLGVSSAVGGPPVARPGVSAPPVHRNQAIGHSAAPVAVKPLAPRAPVNTANGGAAVLTGTRAPACQPGAREICGDRIDNNCNGVVDEGCSVPQANVAKPGIGTFAQAVPLPNLPAARPVQVPVYRGPSSCFQSNGITGAVCELTPMVNRCASNQTFISSIGACLRVSTRTTLVRLRTNPQMPTCFAINREVERACR